MSDDSPSPRERADEAVQSALNKLERANDADTAIKAGRLEEEAKNEAVEAVAQALVDGLDKHVGYYAQMLWEKSDYFNKSDITQEISDRSEELAADGSEKATLEGYITNHLARVIVHRNTDAKQGAKFTFDFGNCQVQTESGKDGRGHYNWPNFRDYIHEAGGPSLAKPSKAVRGGEEWREFMVQLIDNHGEERHVTGKRTRAVEKLQKTIKSHAGYGTATSALDNNAPWIVVSSFETPEWWGVFALPLSEPRDLSLDGVKEVRIHETVIDEVTTNPDITRHGLYQELDARGHTVPGSGGPSMVKYVDGSEERFWTLLPSIGTPRTYVPDPRADTKGAGSLLAELEQQDESTDTPERDSDGFEGVGELA